MTLREMIHEGDYSAMRVIGIVPNMEAAAAAQQRLAPLSSVARSEIITDFVPKDQPTKLRLWKTEGSYPRTRRYRCRANCRGNKSRFCFFAIGCKTPGWKRALRRCSSALAAALDDFTAKQGTDPEAFAKLQDRLIGALPRRLNDLRQGLTAGPFALMTYRKISAITGSPLRVKVLSPFIRGRRPTMFRAWLNSSPMSVPSSLKLSAPPVAMTDAGLSVGAVGPIATIIAFLAMLRFFGLLKVVARHCLSFIADGIERAAVCGLVVFQYALQLRQCHYGAVADRSQCRLRRTYCLAASRSRFRPRRTQYQHQPGVALSALTNVVSLWKPGAFFTPRHRQYG